MFPENRCSYCSAPMDKAETTPWCGALCREWWEERSKVWSAEDKLIAALRAAGTQYEIVVL